MHHLLFVVHGMGQMRDKFVRNCKAMQDTLEFIASNRDFNGQELHIIPIEWHSILHKLPSVDARMDKVTLPTVPLFRMINNHYLADLLYYFARFHGKAIVSICADLMNAQYLHYTEKYGSVECSLMGHSLGGIISYDILCHQVRYLSLVINETA